MTLPPENVAPPPASEALVRIDDALKAKNKALAAELLLLKGGRS
jgi:hypothetical protein